MASRVAVPMALLMGALGAGCSSLDNPESTCESLGLEPCNPDGENGTGGTEMDSMTLMTPEWKCLVNPTAPPAPQTNAQTVTYVVPIVDFDSQPTMFAPVEGLTITVCPNETCDPPAGAETVRISNLPDQPPFVYAITMPYNFQNASLRLTAPNYVPMDYFFGGPMVGPPEGGTLIRGQAIPMLRLSARDTLYRGLGLPTPASPETGDLAARALNCRRDEQGRTTRAAGVTLEALPPGPDSSAIGYALSFGNRATPGLVTDDRGTAGFANLEPRNYVVQGRAPVEGDDGMAYGQTIASIRPGVITVVEIREGQDEWGQ